MDDIDIQKYPVPFQEQERIEELKSLNILDSEPDPEFDRFTRLAAYVLDAPVSVVSLIDEDRQWFKSCFGFDASETPRDVAFCAHTIMSDEAMIIPDATKDPRFCDNPLVTGAPHIRFYAGAPLISEKGFRLGSLCVIDFEPHEEIDDRDIQALHDLADLTSEAITLRAAKSDTDARLARSQKAADNAKQAFLAMLSHELRTPLNAIIGFTSLIREKFASDNEVDYVDYADMVEKSGYALLERVESMLNWTQIQRGEMELNDSHVEILTLLEDCQKAIPELSGQVPSPEILISRGDIPPALICDRDQVEHVLINILRNAIQCSDPQSTITIEIRVRDGLSIVIQDQGCGMTADALERALSSFEHADNNPLHTQNGLGLGLPLSRRIVEMHGGRMEIESEVGVGTAVSIHFPDYRLKLN